MNFFSLRRLPFSLTLLLVFTLPFESIWSLLRFPWAQFTNLELLLAVTALVWGVYLVKRQSAATFFTNLARRHWRPLFPLLAFLTVSLVSALLAPAHTGDAIKVFSRFVNGAFAYLLARAVAGYHDYLRQLLWAIVAGAGISALIGLGEAAGWGWLDPLLQLFKRQPTYVGNAIRVSASFQYATIAAMFLEMVVPVALALAATGTARRRWLAAAIAALCTLVVVLTLTRAGIFALALIFLFLFLLTRYWPALRPPLLLSSLTLLLASLLLAFHSPEFRARLSQETDNAWYRASYHAPAHITLPAGQAAPVTVRVTNDSPVFWQASGPFPIRLRYRWLTADGQAAFALPFGLQPLPHDLPPGETVALTIPLQPPLPPGSYRLAWGLEHADRFWFHHRGVPDAESLVTVSPGDHPGQTTALLPAIEPRSDQIAVNAGISRQQLWAAAWAMFRQRPLLGVGPGNFRHLYGPYLGLDQWDRGIHANSLYLELLADTGALGLLSFTALLLITGRQTIHFYRRLPAQDTHTRDAPLWAIGLTSAILIFLLHGFFDYFLEFVPTYLLFWLCLGLLSGLTAPAAPAPDC